MALVSCQDAVAHIAAANVPVLFLDTCSVLDLIRAPVRDSVGQHDITAAHTLLGRAETSPPTLIFVIDKQVSDEFAGHVNDVEANALGELRKLTGQVNDILGRMVAFPAAAGIPAGIDLTAIGFPAEGRAVAERVMRASLTVEDDHAEQLKAIQRVNSAIPPATREKQSVKDCIITETYLRIGAELGTLNLGFNKVFITSNKADYEENRRLHPVLRQQFTAIGLEYAPSWSAARFEVDRK